jgi:hypothetical protein
MLDLTDKDFNPVFGHAKMVFKTNKRYPVRQFPHKSEQKTRKNSPTGYSVESANCVRKGLDPE